MTWKHAPWLVIDVETTGFGPRDRIVELAAVPFLDGVPGPRMAQLVDPGIPIPQDAIDVHGIRNIDVADMPSFSDVAPGFMRHVDEADVIVGYNFGFDRRFLVRELGFDPFEFKIVIDPFIVVRRSFPKGSRSLVKACEEVGVAVGQGEENNAHSASYDCLLTGMIMWQLAQHLPEDWSP